MRNGSDERFSQEVSLLTHLGSTNTGCELAGHHRNDNEENQIDEVDRVIDAEVIDRRVEEKGFPAYRDHSRDDRRNNPAKNRGEQNRDQINNGDGADVSNILQ